MAYIQKNISKKMTSGKVQVLFLIGVNRNVRFRYKTPCYIDSALWNSRSNNLRTVARSTNIPADQLEELKKAKDLLVEIEKKIEFLVTEFPEQVCMKSVPPQSDSSSAKEEYWMNIVLDALANIKSDVLKREDVEKIFKKTDNKINDTTNFFSLTQTFIEKRNLCTGRVHSYNVIFRSMARYEIFRNKIAGINWHWGPDTTTSDDIDSFFEFFKNEKDYREKYKRIFNKLLKLYPVECASKHKAQIMRAKGDNYIAVCQKKVKAFWHWMIKNGITTNNPFLGVEVCQERYGTPFYITIEERNHIADFDLSSNSMEETQRDIFIFQCLIGCRVGDLTKLTKDNIVNGILIYTPHKTKDHTLGMQVRVPLCKRALDLIAKYDSQDQNGKLFPFISKHKYNIYIKKILEDCGIERMVNVRDSVTGENKMRRICDVASSHMARRTFVGNAYKQVKDASLVGKMSGHVDGSKAFARYRNIDDDMLREVVDLIQ